MQNNRTCIYIYIYTHTYTYLYVYDSRDIQSSLVVLYMLVLVTPPLILHHVPPSSFSDFPVTSSLLTVPYMGLQVPQRDLSGLPEVVPYKQIEPR